MCQTRPPYSKGGKSYPTCGMTCAKMLELALNQSGPVASPGRNGYGSRRGRGGRPVAQVPPVSPLLQHLGSYATPPRQRNHGGPSRQYSPAPATTMTMDLCVVGSPRSKYHALFSFCSLGLFGKALSRYQIRYMWAKMCRKTMYYRRGQYKSLRCKFDLQVLVGFRY